ncbi:hypothetical protein BJ508DRAFT_10422 [Ascobolus immersus RN42]|uniref:Secreted protein n=1 Tax=Ascobolus immersus RN42 TaxID=1160509 RepID=A0A3N4HSG9_ASCIM|nr:hypothetical protein BJ508DRAFT_10422 [Ascobolus immersus RN42]
MKGRRFMACRRLVLGWVRAAPPIVWGVQGRRGGGGAWGIGGALVIPGRLPGGGFIATGTSRSYWRGLDGGRWSKPPTGRCGAAWATLLVSLSLPRYFLLYLRITIPSFFIHLFL